LCIFFYLDLFLYNFIYLCLVGFFFLIYFLRFNIFSLLNFVYLFSYQILS